MNRYRKIILVAFGFLSVCGCSGHSISLNIRVVDQAGVAVPDAKIVYVKGYTTIVDSISCFGFAGCGLSEEFNTATDNSGYAKMFVYGSHLSIRKIDHPGYLILGGYKALSNDKTVLTSAEIEPTKPNDPLVIRAWKIQPPPNKLVSGWSNASGKFPTNSFVNIIRLGEAPTYLVVEWDRYFVGRDDQALVKVSVLDAELQIADDLYPFVAPDEGYIGEWSGEVKRGGLAKKKFYIRDKQKRFYGYLELDLDSYRRYERYINYSFLVNLSGERNLQPGHISRDYKPTP